MVDREEKKAARGRGAPRKVSEGYLERAALHYLGRFSSTEANLHAVLGRKIRRRNEDHSAPSDEQLAWVDAVVAKCVRLGYVDDASYARQRIEMLIRRGKPKRMIAQDLRHKGVPEAIAAAQLRAYDEQADEEADRQAAASYIRRRRFGPFRRVGRDTEGKLEKERAAMMRAGFSFSLIKELLEASEDGLMALLP